MKLNPILIGMILLAGCDQTPPQTQSQFCLAPIKADACTKTWLAQQHPPACVNHWANLIADQQDAIKKACP